MHSAVNYESPIRLRSCCRTSSLQESSKKICSVLILLKNIAHISWYTFSRCSFLSVILTMAEKTLQLTELILLMGLGSFYKWGLRGGELPTLFLNKEVEELSLMLLIQYQSGILVNSKKDKDKECHSTIFHLSAWPCLLLRQGHYIQFSQHCVWLKICSFKWSQDCIFIFACLAPITVLFLSSSKRVYEPSWNLLNVTWAIINSPAPILLIKELGLQYQGPQEANAFACDNLGFGK